MMKFNRIFKQTLVNGYRRQHRIMSTSPTNPNDLKQIAAVSSVWISVLFACGFTSHRTCNLISNAYQR